MNLDWFALLAVDDELTCKEPRPICRPHQQSRRRASYQTGSSSQAPVFTTVTLVTLTWRGKGSDTSRPSTLSWISEIAWGYLYAPYQDRAPSPPRPALAERPSIHPSPSRQRWRRLLLTDIEPPIQLSFILNHYISYLDENVLAASAERSVRFVLNYSYLYSY